MISIAGQFHSGEEITNDGMEPLWNLRNIPDCSFGEGKVLEKPNMGGICLQRWPLRKLSTLFTLLHKWQQNILTFIAANYYQKSLSNISLTSLNIHLLLFKTHKPRFAIIVEETGSSLFLQLPPTHSSLCTNPTLSSVVIAIESFRCLRIITGSISLFWIFPQFPPSQPPSPASTQFSGECSFSGVASLQNCNWGETPFSNENGPLRLFLPHQNLKPLRPV